MRRNDPPFTFRLVPLILEIVGLGPREAEAMLERCGLPAEAAREPCTAPLSVIRRFVDEAARRAGQGAFGLTIAERVPEGTYETAEVVVRTAPTLGAGLAALARYAALINPIGRFEYTERGAAELHYFVPGLDEGLGCHLNEHTIAYVVRALGRVVSSPIVLGSVWFSHRRRSGAEAVRDHFGCEPRFGAATCGFSFPLATAARPLALADPVVFAYLERHAEDRLRAIGPRTFAGAVADAIERHDPADAGLDAVARRIGATPRTVQRRLREDGTSFREVLDQVRRRKAQGMAGAPAERVAEALGFADVRSYRRAEARWRDVTEPGTGPGTRGRAR